MNDNYDKEIQDISKVIPLVLEIIQGFEYIIHTAEEEDYNFLADEGVEIQVINPNSGEDLDIRFDEEILMAFNKWHSHYYAYESFVFEMLDHLQRIIQNKVYVAIIGSTKRWLTSTMRSESISNVNECKSFVEREMRIDEFKDEIRTLGGVVDLVYWNPELNKSFKI